MNSNNNEIMIYEDRDGITKINVKFMNEDLWITKYQLAEIYKTTRQNIEQHIKNIYQDKELNEESTCKNFLQVQKEGNREVKMNIDHYNLDMIIALGYRVQSEVAVRFRIWATGKLHEYIQKGFTMDDVKIAKNYLSEIELQRLNLLVSQFLDYAELQALEQRSMKMADWVEELDNQILLNRRKILEGNGKISHEEAIKKAEKEFNIYREREMRELQSDFDLMMKLINNNQNDTK